MTLFAKSVAMGLAIAAPLGPIGALCIQRTLARGFAAGVAGGLGTALADAL
ncbi:LysE family translocator, partial [Candidatus Falkowbacteria bacterium]|nr:LysE family translocator [Candidatus Falkowbacteria bacterium]